MNRKTKEIELFGEKLLLSERTAGDVLSMVEFSKTNSSLTVDIITYQSAKTIESALKINVEILKWYNFKRKRLLKKITSLKYIIGNLSVQKIISIAQEVFELEGLKVNEDNSDSKKNMT